MLDYVHFFVAGILAYQVWSRKGMSVVDWLMVGAVVLAILQRYPIGVSLALVVVLILFMGLAARQLSWIVCAPLIWLGGISYPLYLIHQNIGYVVMEKLSLGPNLEVVLAIAISLILAQLISSGIERPAMKGLRTWWHRHKR